MSRAHCLAPSPDCFSIRNYVVPAILPECSAYEINNRGLEIELRLFKLTRPLRASRNPWSVHQRSLARPYQARAHFASVFLPPNIAEDLSRNCQHYAAILDCSSSRHPSMVYILQLRQYVGTQFTFGRKSACKETDWWKISQYLEESNQKLVRQRIMSCGRQKHSQVLSKPRMAMTSSRFTFTMFSCPAGISPDVADHHTSTQARRPAELLYRQPARKSPQIPPRTIDPYTLDEVPQSLEYARLGVKYSPGRSDAEVQAASKSFAIFFRRLEGHVLDLGISQDECAKWNNELSTPDSPMPVPYAFTTISHERCGKTLIMHLGPFNEVHVRATFVNATGTNYWAIEVTVAERRPRLEGIRQELWKVLQGCVALAHDKGARVIRLDDFVRRTFKKLDRKLDSFQWYHVLDHV